MRSSFSSQKLQNPFPIKGNLFIKIVNSYGRFIWFALLWCRQPWGTLRYNKNWTLSGPTVLGFVSINQKQCHRAINPNYYESNYCNKKQLYKWKDNVNFIAKKWKIYRNFSTNEIKNHKNLEERTEKNWPSEKIRNIYNFIVLLSAWQLIC